MISSIGIVFEKRMSRLSDHPLGLKNASDVLISIDAEKTVHLLGNPVITYESEL